MSELDMIHYYGANDFAIPEELMKCEKILNDFGSWETYGKINQIVSLYNLKRYIDSGTRLRTWSDETYSAYKNRSKKILEIIGRFFKRLEPSMYANLYENTDVLNKEDFWELYCELKQYKNLDNESFKEFIFQTNVPLGYILTCKDMVSRFGQVIREYILSDARNVEFLVRTFLEKKNPQKKECFLPRELTSADKERLVQKYINLPDPGMNCLKLLSQENNPDKLQLSDRTKFLALKRFRKMQVDFLETNGSIKTTAAVQFSTLDGTGSIKYHSEDLLNPKIEYDSRWIEDNLDNATILQNFYWFDFVDLKSRCNLVSIKSDFSIIDLFWGSNGQKEYPTGPDFEIRDSFALLQMRGYYELLKRHGVELEDVFRWFFEKYLKSEFNADGFVYDETSLNAKFGERNRLIASKIDHVLKQFDLYCKNLEIDREYLEFSSQQIDFSQVPSFTKNKYAYCDSEKLKMEVQYLFSSQSLLTYSNRTQKGYSSFVEMIVDERHYYNDFNGLQQSQIDYLIQRGAIIKTTNGSLSLDRSRLGVLIQLYKKECLCVGYEDLENDPLKILLTKNELRLESSLFSEPEQKYLNYLLNKSKFSNGLDLRNRYIHSTNSLDENVNYTDYLRFLIVMAIIVVKINEEFVLRDATEQEKRGSFLC